MSLILTVLSFKGQPITGIPAVSIGYEGGSIGRSSDNSLVLPDTEKFVSRHHAHIKAENNGYYLSDTSLGGVYLNGEEPALHNATVRLNNGATLRIGEYDIAVAIIDETASTDNDSPFSSLPITPALSPFLNDNEPWLDTEQLADNPLMADNFPSHEELVQRDTTAPPAAFHSDLSTNQSPLFDSYIAPTVTAAPIVATTATIPESFSFDELFADTEITQSIDKPAVQDDFASFFDNVISGMVADNSQEIITEQGNEIGNDTSAMTASPVEDWQSSATKNEHLDNDTPTESIVTESLISEPFQEIPALADIFTHNDTVTPNAIPPAAQSLAEPVISPVIEEKIAPIQADNVLFDAFLQGVAVACNDIQPEQHAATLHRIGQMFRKLIDGTVAVLRSRAEFKSVCRVSMTVIRASDNNPLKFTVSTEDVLRQLIENKTDGFLASTTAIEEAFNDIMNHQLAMQAGIQASLTDLLTTFDPKNIEKQFEQGLVLQKKSKCWDSYEKTYHTTVENAVENFFGDEFVKAYERQMRLLSNARKKS